MTTQTTHPAKGTPEYALWVAAIEVAIQAPERPGQHVSKAQIPWPVISELRAALDAVGIDWRSARERDQTRRRERMAELDGR